MLTSNIYNMGADLGNPGLIGNVIRRRNPGGNIRQIYPMTAPRGVIVDGSRSPQYEETYIQTNQKQSPIQKIIESQQLQQQQAQQQEQYNQMVQQMSEPQKVKVDLGIPGMQYPKPYPFQTSGGMPMAMNPEINYIQQQKMMYQQQMDKIKAKKLMSNVMNTLSSKNPNFQNRFDYFGRRDMRNMFKLKGGKI